MLDTYIMIARWDPSHGFGFQGRLVCRGALAWGG